jgi:hypothetical protein
VLCELGWTALATEDLPEARRWFSERIEALKAAVPQDALDALVARGRSLTPSEVMAMVTE